MKQMIKEAWEVVVCFLKKKESQGVALTWLKVLLVTGAISFSNMYVNAVVTSVFLVAFYKVFTQFEFLWEGKK